MNYNKQYSILEQLYINNQLTINATMNKNNEKVKHAKFYEIVCKMDMKN